MKSFQKSLNYLSVCYLLIGIALMIWPAQLLQIACYAVGAIVLFAGLSSIIAYLRTKDQLFSSGFTLMMGIVISGLGLFLLLQPKTVASVLPIIVGLFVFFDGIGRLQTAWQLKQAEYANWWKLTLPSVLSAGLGALIFFNPFDTATLMVQVVGAILTFEGVLNLFTSIFTSRVLRNLEKMGRQMDQEMEELEQAAMEEDHAFRPEGQKPIDTEWKEL